MSVRVAEVMKIPSAIEIGRWRKREGREMIAPSVVEVERVRYPSKHTYFLNNLADCFEFTASYLQKAIPSVFNTVLMKEEMYPWRNVYLFICIRSE